MSYEEAMFNMETKVIHSNEHKDQFGAVVMPIYQTSTFVFDSAEQGGKRFAGEESGYIYTRLGNPTVSSLEGRLACLEGAEACACMSSGMGAISSTVLRQFFQSLLHELNSHRHVSHRSQEWL